MPEVYRGKLYNVCASGAPPAGRRGLAREAAVGEVALRHALRSRHPHDDHSLLATC